MFFMSGGVCGVYSACMVGVLATTVCTVRLLYDTPTSN
jgi:hypothetical protein